MSATFEPIVPPCSSRIKKSLSLRCASRGSLEKSLVEIYLLVSRQTARIERLAEKGGDTTQAKAVLRGLEEVLEYFRTQQRMILDTLARG